MFVYWLHMNMATHGFDSVALKYKVGDYTNSIWGVVSYENKSYVVLASIYEEILGTGTWFS